MRTGAALRQETPDVPIPPWKRRWFQTASIFALAVLGAYALIYRDVVSRAQASFTQAELHMAWHRDPAAKQTFFDEKFSSMKAALDAELSAKKVSPADYRRRLDAAQFDRDFALSESSVKYAYQWYKDTYEMFSPPESAWVKNARQKAPEALELWKAELRARKVPFDESMFE